MIHSPAPFFMTHHAPVAAWASLTFGLPGRGLAIDHEKLVSEANADLLVAVHRDGVTSALPFIERNEDYPNWRIASASEMTRTLSPCVDTMVAEAAGVTLRVFSPHAALPNPKRSGNLQYSTVPGVLFELTIDNSGSDAEARAFVGVRLHGSDALGAGGGRLRPLDWSSKTLCGVANSSKWALAAQPVKDSAETGAVATILTNDPIGQLAAGTAEIVPNSSTGGVLIKVAPRAKRTVMLVFAFYNQGNATQGIEGRYLYTMYFPRVEAVANFILANSQKILDSCSSFDGRASAACQDPVKLAVFSQAIRAYEANTQLIDAAGAPYFTTISGGTGYRNALSLAVDHLPWELYRNPWVIRNIFDLATTSYAYQDKIRFPSDVESPDELREGGMTFVHDFGFHSCYSPSGTSSAEAAGKPGVYMATEDLLNGVYLLTSYALLADDTPWAKTRLPFARELMLNMENRDHWDPEKRTGIMKGQTERAGTNGGAERCVLGAIGDALGVVPGNLYLAVKTFCANLMLTTYYQGNNDLHSADYSYAFAQKTAQAVVAAFDASAGILPANLLAPDTSAGAPRLIAAIEPLAVPTYHGLTTTLPEYFPELFNVLKTHAISCLKNAPEGCIDPATGGLRLASNTPVVLPGKVVNVLFVLERLLGIDVQGEFPSLWREVLAWSQTASANTMADLVDCEKRIAIGEVNSPRLITSALFVKPVVAATV